MAQQTRNITYGAHIQSFRYDQLMRLNSFRSFKPDANGLSLWNLASTASAGVAGTAPLQTDSKEESITYDRNGNLSNYQRWGTGSATLMDNMGYVLYPNSNRLEYVVDGVAAGTFGSDFDGQSPANYAYDGAGKLIKDAQSGISTGDILWTPYGKVRQVNVFGGNSVTRYDYDAQQNRVFKSIQNFAGTNNTYYVRDIQGNVMATYTQNGATFTWAEQHLYGSSRLGMLRPEVSWSTAPPAIPHFASTRLLRYGTKRYEVNDHLGNVRASISDRRQFSSTIFDPVISDATDYFPFGAPNRTVSSSAGYRYGFNGKELDKSNEFGTANVYDYGFRIYNPSIGRFLSVDPLTSKYPSWTPYAFAMNRPIDGVDLDGLEYISINNVAFQKKGNDWLSRWWNREYNQVVEKNLSLIRNRPIVTIASDKYYDVGDHLYLYRGKLSRTGQRYEQVTHASRVGIQLFENMNMLPPKPSDAPTMPYVGTTNEETIDLVKKTYEAANLYADCYGVCYATTATRVNKAYKTESGYNVFNLNPSSKNPDFTLMSTGAVSNGAEDFYGYGVGGALLRHGLGTAVDDVGVWGGKLQEGALLQVWHSTDPNNLYVNGGHSQIFRKYTYGATGRISGLVVFDNSGDATEVLYREFYEGRETIKAVNLKDIPRRNN